MQITLGSNYTHYSSALKQLNLDTLEARRIILCKKFGKKAVINPKHTNWFKPNNKVTVTRQPQPKFCPVVARTKRFEKSPISYLTMLLNKYSKSSKWLCIIPNKWIIGARRKFTHALQLCFAALIFLYLITKENKLIIILLWHTKIYIQYVSFVY